jgi:hypothetical protein
MAAAGQVDIARSFPAMEIERSAGVFGGIG